jgi:serine-type D-Ala-D-Ala carboxypeptidase (penicillin-binding protein 5/6)
MHSEQNGANAAENNPVTAVGAMRLSARLAILPVLAAVAAVAIAAVPASAATANAIPASAVPAITVPASTVPARAVPASAVPASAVPAAAPTGTAPAAAAPAGIRALGADLAVAGGGQVLWGRDLNTKRPMGSITKVMTALLVIEAGDLSRRIKVPAAAVTYVADHDASSAGLRAGDVLTARQLLYALLLPSGCDAAYVLATAYGPGRAAFIAKMNAEAQQLGLTKTYFANFDGLPYPTPRATYSTPADLIALGNDAMALATFRTIVGQQTYHVFHRTGHHAYTWHNTNLLLGSYAGADGIKTGSTSAAGYCLLFEAVSGTSVLIGVVLHSTAANPSRQFTDATRMLNWGFGDLAMSAALAGRLDPPDP